MKSLLFESPICISTIHSCLANLYCANTTFAHAYIYHRYYDYRQRAERVENPTVTRSFPLSTSQRKHLINAVTVYIQLYNTQHTLCIYSGTSLEWYIQRNYSRTAKMSPAINFIILIPVLIIFSTLILAGLVTLFCKVGKSIADCSIYVCCKDSQKRTMTIRRKSERPHTSSESSTQTLLSTISDKSLVSITIEEPQAREASASASPDRPPSYARLYPDLVEVHTNR